MRKLYIFNTEIDLSSFFIEKVLTGILRLSVLYGKEVDLPSFVNVSLPLHFFTEVKFGKKFCRNFFPNQKEANGC